MVLGINDIGESSGYLYNGLGAMVENTWVVKKNAYGYHDVNIGTDVEGEVVVDFTTGKAEKKEKKTAEVLSSPTLNKSSTVVKQYVVDYTSKTYEPLMEYEVGGLDYRYVYGNDRLSVDIKNNMGKEIDITPSLNHSTTTKNPGLKGEPSSSVDILDSNGNIITRRWYGPDGKLIRDVDFTLC